MREPARQGTPLDDLIFCLVLLIFSLVLLIFCLVLLIFSLILGVTAFPVSFRVPYSASKPTKLGRRLCFDVMSDEESVEYLHKPTMFYLPSVAMFHKPTTLSTQHGWCSTWMVPTASKRHPRHHLPSAQQP